MNWEDRITLDPAVLVGKPVIRGTRLSVEFIVGLLANGWSIEDVLKEYDHITREDIQACLAYAHYLLAEEKLYPFRRNFPDAVPRKAASELDLLLWSKCDEFGLLERVPLPVGDAITRRPPCVAARVTFGYRG